MEKYRQFADSSTGINPFVPTWETNKKKKWINIIVLPILILRFLILVPTSIILALFLSILDFIYFDHLRVIFSSILAPGLSRIVLLLLGCIWINEDLETRFNDLQLDIKKNQLGNEKCCKLVFSNRQSFIDILIYLILLKDPKYMFARKSCLICIKNPLVAILYSFDIQISYSVTILTNSTMFLSNLNSPRSVVVFMEEVNTNGSCILKWNPNKCLNLSTRNIILNNINLYRISYHSQFHYGPQFTTGNTTYHLLKMIFNLPFYIAEIKMIPNQYIFNTINNITSKNINNHDHIENMNDYLDYLLNIQSDINKIPIVIRSIEDYKKFIKYWNNTQKKSYI
ncbi:hypothetical protein cand_029130 [Cryptosporidium andersoni]|uniref:Transmembrane protein n=1 Tax=Cryptosporidium andersoni TaxID=117008 RepID=A0A1J4MSF4_9CRYT|nr:hypothetical protein cand_029130 [Cryptosporidium andersoni]